MARRVAPLRSELLDLLAHITAVVEFSEEDIPEVAIHEVRDRLIMVAEQLDEMLRHAQQGQVLQHGVSLTIVGTPNVGKSSILNGLLGRERAIVTAIPGTTRDTLEEELNVGGILFRVVDTAGVTETKDPVEAIGIERSRAALDSADVVVLVVDGSRSISSSDESVMELVRGQRSVVVAFNKSDLTDRMDAARVCSVLPDAVIVSSCAIQPGGLESLREALPGAALGGPAPDGFVISNRRHIQSLSDARESVNQATSGLEGTVPLDLLSLDLRRAVECLGSILGIGIGDDVLDRVFSRFCIGK